MNSDPSKHLALAHRVIKQMGLYGDMAEEAYSESLVLITEAAQKYDPAREVPLANWLAKNIRWGLATWIAKQKAAVPLPITLEAPQKPESGRIELSDLIGRMQRLLTHQERSVLLYMAAGYKGTEIAKISGLSTVQVSLIKTRAQRKLRKDETQV